MGLNSSSYYSVLVIDNTKCDSPIYVVSTDAQSIKVEGNQIDYSGNIAPNGTEAFIYVKPPYSETGKFTYKLTATYSNCESITSEERIVELGWLLYELIDQSEIKHTVRAR